MNNTYLEVFLLRILWTSRCLMTRLTTAMACYIEFFLYILIFDNWKLKSWTKYITIISIQQCGCTISMIISYLLLMVAWGTFRTETTKIIDAYNSTNMTMTAMWTYTCFIYVLNTWPYGRLCERPKQDKMIDISLWDILILKCIILRQSTSKNDPQAAQLLQSYLTMFAKASIIPWTVFNLWHWINM